MSDYIPKLSVRAIPSSDAYPLILHEHYARRKPSISNAFGLFEGEELVGVCTFGSPPSTTLKRGLVGSGFPYGFIELNRLCLLHNRKNEASMLVARSLALLPKPLLVISFADTSRAHVGTVYQATNAIYLGLSSKRTDWALRSRPNLHGKSISDQFKGADAAARARAHYGDDFYLKPRPLKHRYVWLLGGKRDLREMLACLKHPAQPYPKAPEWMK